VKKPDKIIREGDRVRVINPVFVTRVGYPKQPSDYAGLVTVAHGAALEAIFKPYADSGKAKRIRKRLEQDLAYLQARDDNFGGRERTLHFLVVPDRKGAELNVGKVVTRKTGTYYPPSISYKYISYDQGDDWAPGGLADEKTHRLASVSNLKYLNYGIYPMNAKLDLWIEVENLEKL